MPDTASEKLRTRLMHAVRTHEQRTWTDDEALHIMRNIVLCAAAGLLGPRANPMTCESVAEVIRSLPPAYRAALEAALRDATDDECRSATVGVSPQFKDPQPLDGTHALARAAFGLRHYLRTNDPQGE